MNVVNDKPFETLQEVFEIGIMRLLRQGHTTKNTGQGCVYRTKDKQSGCLIGQLIPDEAWPAEYNTASVYAILGNSPNLPQNWIAWRDAQPAFSYENADDLHKIQTLHDGCDTNRERFVSNCKRVAKELNLDASFLDSEEAIQLLEKFTFSAV